MGPVVVPVWGFVAAGLAAASATGVSAFSFKQAKAHGEVAKLWARDVKTAQSQIDALTVADEDPLVRTRERYCSEIEATLAGDPEWDDFRSRDEQVNEFVKEQATLYYLSEGDYGQFEVPEGMGTEAQSSSQLSSIAG